MFGKARRVAEEASVAVSGAAGSAGEFADRFSNAAEAAGEYAVRAAASRLRSVLSVAADEFRAGRLPSEGIVLTATVGIGATSLQAQLTVNPLVDLLDADGSVPPAGPSVPKPNGPVDDDISHGDNTTNT